MEAGKGIAHMLNMSLFGRLCSFRGTFMLWLTGSTWYKVVALVPVCCQVELGSCKWRKPNSSTSCRDLWCKLCDTPHSECILLSIKTAISLWQQKLGMQNKIIKNWLPSDSYITSFLWISLFQQTSGYLILFLSKPEQIIKISDQRWNVLCTKIPNNLRFYHLYHIIWVWWSLCTERGKAWNQNWMALIISLSDTALNKVMTL